jgi:hypothetical protein
VTKKNSTAKEVGGDSIQISIGDGAHHIAAGKGVRQIVGEPPQSQVTKADLAAVHQLFEDLRHEIEAQAPSGKKDSAVDRATELEEAILAEEPDLTTMEYVKNWFTKYVPQLAGAVVSVLVNPIVGKVVEAAGDLAAGELKRLFGGKQEA